MKILILALMVLSLISCNEDEITKPSNNNDINYTLQYSGGSYSLNQVINSFNNNNLNGVIELESILRNDYTISGNGTVKTYNPFSGINDYAYAGLFNSSMQPISIPNIDINGATMKQFATGKYSNIQNITLDLNFGNGLKNYFELDSNSTFGSVRDSFSLSSRVQLLGLNRGDTLSVNDTLNFNWTGGSSTSNKVYFRIEKTETIDDVITPTNHNVGFGVWIDNTGNYKQYPINSQSSIQRAGLYDVIITIFEPVYKNLPNGKQILILGESTHRVAVYITL